MIKSYFSFRKIMLFAPIFFALSSAGQTSTPCNMPGLTAGDTGCVNFLYNGVSTTYTTVRGADGNIWLQQNLGSSQVAKSMTDASSYGDLFQWGRWNDGHEDRTSAISAAPTPNDPSGISSSTSFVTGTSTTAWWNSGSLTDSWSAASPSGVSSTDGCDPCKALGNGWVMPTETDWSGIKTAEGISNPTTAFSSNLLLPASGYRSSSTGTFTHVDLRGYFWSSTTSTTGAKYFYIGTTIANPSAGAMRGQAHAVRCIYKGTVATVASVTVSTLGNVPEDITVTGGTLALTAAVTPSSANQNVTWSISSGSAVATVDNAGLVTALSDGTAVIRATSVADTSIYDELTVTVNTATSTPCTAVQTFLEDFETFTTFPENCWTSNKKAPYIDLNKDAKTGNHSINFYSFFNAADPVYLVSPEVSTIDGQHFLSFDITGVEANAVTTTLQVGTLSDPADFTTFSAVETAFNPTVGPHATAAVPANPGHKYLAIKYTPNAQHQALFIDNVEWRTATAATGDFDVRSVKIYPNPTSGLFYIETEAAVKSIEVYNTAGQRILKTNRKEIDLSQAANGLYIVNVHTPGGTVASYRLVKK